MDRTEILALATRLFPAFRFETDGLSINLEMIDTHLSAAGLPTTDDEAVGDALVNGVIPSMIGIKLEGGDPIWPLCAFLTDTHRLFCGKEHETVQ